uniref:Non-structural protein 7b n=1 Tax=Feline coronavirus TaxID=12663 RepID=A0A2H4KI35_9ALPC|nr:nonstructural protein 7b [Feline coronavirus]
MIVVVLVCIFLANGIKATIVPVDPHEHPVLTWELLRKFLGSTLYITTHQILALPLGSRVECESIGGFNCTWPGFQKPAHDHIDFHFDLSNPFYSFVDTFYIVGEGYDRIKLRLVGAVPKHKRLNVGCHTSFAVDLPFGTQIYHDMSFEHPVSGRHLECAHRVYFVKYCPYNLHGYCFNEKLKVFDLKQLRSKKVFDKINQHHKNEL